MLPLRDILSSSSPDNRSPNFPTSQSKRRKTAGAPPDDHNQSPNTCQESVFSPPLRAAHTPQMLSVQRRQPSAPFSSHAFPPLAPAPPLKPNNRPILLASDPPASKSNPKKRPRAAASPSKGTRKARPAYAVEQDHFIVFCRDDLCQSWDSTKTLYNQHWHPGDEDQRNISGLQARYYRVLQNPVRKRTSRGRPELGLLYKTNRRYWWMGGAYTDDERAGLEDPTQTAMMEGLTSSTSGSGSSHDGGDNQEMEELESELGDGDGDDNGDSVDDELASSSVKSMDLDDKAKDKEPISPSSASYDDDDDYYEKCLGLSDPTTYLNTLRIPRHGGPSSRVARKIRSRFKLEERLERRKKQQEPQMEVDIGREDEGVSVDSMDHLECDTFQLSRDGGNSVFVYNDKISA